MFCITIRNSKTRRTCWRKLWLIRTGVFASKQSLQLHGWIKNRVLKCWQLFQTLKKVKKADEGNSNEIIQKGTRIGVKLKGKKVTKIEISLKGKGTINLNEIEIYSGGKNIARQAKGSMSSFYSDGTKIDKMVDGNKSNFTHTKQDSLNPYLRFEFDSPVAVEEVIIWNRKHFEGRINNGVLSFFNGNQPVAAYTIKARNGGSDIGN